jgi:pyrroloquinoline quinone (PQQ) biosynthesis protein C
MSDSTLVDTTTGTPVPAWLRELDERCQPYLQAMLEFPQTVELDDDKMRTSMVQAGIGIVEPFRHWLSAMKQRVEPGTKAYQFLDENEAEEAEHWDWWIDMAGAFGLTRADFENITLRPPMQALTDYLTEVSRSAPLPIAIAAVNYCIETGAAQMSAAFSTGFDEKLGNTAGRWVAVHKEGDVVHSRISRELLGELAGDDENLQRRTGDAAVKAYEMFFAAMADACR